MTTVLIVDDNDVNRFLAVHVLEKRGFAVLQAADGIEALRIVDAQKPDVIVLDIQMPGMSGLDVIARIRSAESPEVSRVPIIAATALAMADDRERCLTQGANSFLSRPFSMKELVDQIRMLIPETQEQLAGPPAS